MVDLSKLPYPEAFEAVMAKGLVMVRAEWGTLTPGLRALVEIAAHAGLDPARAVQVDSSNTDLWVNLPSGAKGAIGIRSDGFCCYGSHEARQELHDVISARLGHEPKDVFTSLVEALSG